MQGNAFTKGQLPGTCRAASVWWRASGLGRVECLILLMLSLGLFLGGAGFWVGEVCSPWPMALGFVCAALGAVAVSWRRLALFLLISAVILAMTIFTFSYTGTDAVRYHVPMQRLLVDGWNPIFESSIERFQCFAGQEGFSLYHTLFLPKLSALCGALMASLTGLFVADAFLGYTLILALWLTAARFAKTQWDCPVPACHVFAAALTLSTKITSFLAGQVDYTAYAAFLVGLLAFLCWRRTRLPGDLFLAGVGLAFSMLAKSTGMVCGGLAIVIGLALAGRRAELRWSVVALVVFVVVVGASPLLTAWVQYGSPFYPSMTFDPAITPVDITADFTGNTDAESMGYLSRMVYAWGSQTLAVKGCALWFGNPGFTPVFGVTGGVGGLGAFFRLMLLGAVAAFIFSRRNAVLWLCLFLFFTANLAPLKYIGYNRYFPQIWAIPFLAAFNLAYAPGAFAARFKKIIRPAIFVGIALFVIPVTVRTLAYQGQQWAFERKRQQTFREMRTQSPAWRLYNTQVSYTLRERMAVAGLPVTTTPDAPTFAVDTQFLMPMFTPEDSGHRLSTRFPICDTLQQLLHFPWHDAFLPPPRPLWIPREHP